MAGSRTAKICTRPPCARWRRKPGCCSTRPTCTDPVWRRTASFSWAGSDLEQTEFFFAARTGGFELDTSGFNALERDTVRDHRWWSAADLATTADQVYPVELPNRLGEAVAQLSTHRVIEPVEIS